MSTNDQQSTKNMGFNSAYFNEGKVIKTLTREKEKKVSRKEGRERRGRKDERREGKEGRESRERVVKKEVYYN